MLHAAAITLFFPSSSSVSSNYFSLSSSILSLLLILILFLHFSTLPFIILTLTLFFLFKTTLCTHLSHSPCLMEMALNGAWPRWRCLPWTPSRRWGLTSPDHRRAPGLTSTTLSIKQYYNLVFSGNFFYWTRPYSHATLRCTHQLNLSKKFKTIISLTHLKKLRYKNEIFSTLFVT